MLQNVQRRILKGQQQLELMAVPPGLSSFHNTIPSLLYITSSKVDGVLPDWGEYALPKGQQPKER